MLPVILSVWFARLRIELLAVTSAEAIEFEATRQLAYVNERLQNDLLI